MLIDWLAFFTQMLIHFHDHIHVRNVMDLNLFTARIRHVGVQQLLHLNVVFSVFLQLLSGKLPRIFTPVELLDLLDVEQVIV